MARARLARSRLVLAAAVVALVGGATGVVPVLAGPLLSSAAAAGSGPLSALPTPSWQTNAEVRQMAYADGDIWLVGRFTTMRPPAHARGHGAVPASYFAAISAHTGALDTRVDHVHSFTGGGTSVPPADEVFSVAASPASSGHQTIYVGGNFTAVDGLPRHHIAAFRASDGQLLPWAPDIEGSGKVTAIATAADTVYVGGTFTATAGTTTTTNLAAFTAVNGHSPASILPNWTPSTNNSVNALAVTPDNQTVVAGGYFDEVDGLDGPSWGGTTAYNKAVILGGEAAEDSGDPRAMPADKQAVPPGTDQAPVNKCSSDVKNIVISGSTAYLANEGTGSGCFDGTWAVNLGDGSLKWVNRCLGATQAVAVVGSYLYKGSHAHNCQLENTNGDPANFPQVPVGHARHLLSENLSNGFLGPWYPLMNAGPDLGPRTMATDGKQLYVGGDFTSVNGHGQQGIARFQTTPKYPTPAPARPIVSSSRPGQVSITATAPVDLDSPTLTLQLFKVGSIKPLAAKTVTSLFWKQPTVKWVRTGIPQDSTQAYKVRAVASGEPPGAMSPPVSVRVACATSAKIRAALRSVKAARQKNGARHLDVELCVGTALSVHLQLRKKDRVVAKTSRHLRRGVKTVRLDIPKRVLSGRYEARVVFVRGTRHTTAARVVHLTR